MKGSCANFNFALRTVLIGLFATAVTAQPPDTEHSEHMAMDAMAMDHMAMAGGMAELDESGIVVDFELTDREGALVTDEDFRGQYVLLGFGYTHCTHICPLMALNMGRVVAEAPRDMTGIFVSVDTERDTPAVTHEYATHFGDSMLGLGGSIEQINAAVKNFKVGYAVTKTQDAYTVQHTANVFLIGPDGALVDVFSFATAPEEILESVR